MSHPLEGVYAKLSRAEENINNLERECRDFLNNNYRHDLIGEYDSTTLKYHVAYPQVPEPPARFAVLAGEILYLLRSSLDHVVGQLVLLENPTHNLKGVQFPVCTDPRKHKSKECGKVKGIRDDAAEVIMKLQPCYGRTEPGSRHPLAFLSSLNNYDKHRSLILLGGLSANSRWDVQVTAKNLQGFEVHFPKKVIQLNHESVTPLGYVRVVPKRNGESFELGDVKIKQKFSFNVAIMKERTVRPIYLVPFLIDMEQRVNRIVKRFEIFFSVE